jgi:hypothetical protein
MFSHALLYGYDPYTQMGIVATIKLDKQWTVQVGLTAGNDVAPWDPGCKIVAAYLHPPTVSIDRLKFTRGSTLF